MVAVLSGGNIDPLLLLRIIRHGMAAAGRYLQFRVRVSDRPGHLARLLADCAAQLAPGGVLVVKDMATRPRWKARLNRLQETVSVRVLRITEGSPDFTFVGPDVRAGWLRDAMLTGVRARRLDRGRAHPHHLLLGRAPAAPAG